MRIAHLSDLHFGKHDEELAKGPGSGSRWPVARSGGGQLATSRSTAPPRNSRRRGPFSIRWTLPFFARAGQSRHSAGKCHEAVRQPLTDSTSRYISTEVEPFLEMDGVALAGLRTSRRARLSFNWADGTISRDQLKALENRFAKSSPDAVRIIVAHHPLMHPEEPMAKPMRRVKRADLALATFARLGVRLVLSGHFHMSYVRRHDQGVEIAAGAPVGANEAAAAPVMVAQALNHDLDPSTRRAPQCLQS